MMTEMPETMHIKAYSINESMEKDVKNALAEMLSVFNCDDMLVPIYTSIKELIVNAIKANFKNIYFENYAHADTEGTSLNYDVALKLFKLELSRDNALFFEEIARREDIRADIDLWVKGQTLHVSVSNPGAMTDMESRLVTRKLAEAHECIDVADYYLKNENDPHREGAGIGLVLITMMLKSLSAPENSFTIKSENNRTTAYIQFPLACDISATA